MDNFNIVNYLAHAYLSGEQPHILVGNMMGDAIKGNTYREQYPEAISRGIVLHRFIDDYMDNHPLCSIGKKRLWSKYRHYSGVLIDMYYDHFLALRWNTYSDIPLHEFAQNVYTTLKDEWNWLPEQTRHMVHYMSTYDWLTSYSEIHGIHRALSGLSRRTKHLSKMEEGTTDLLNYFNEYEAEFHTFFAEIREACKHKLQLL